MTDNQRELPKYKCHKEVWALKIAAVIPEESTNTKLEFAEEGYAPIRVPDEWCHKHHPQAGGYYVVYKDGYTSYSPAEAFEEGYTLIQ